MKYFTIDHDMNRPMPNQINVPLNSEYGIGVRVVKNEQPIELGMDELSVNGMSAVTQVGGYNLYELSSGNDTGMNTLDVEARKEPTVDKEINPVGEAVNTSNRAKPFQIIVPLSDFFDSDITIKPEDVKVLSFKSRYAADTDEYPDEWTDIQNSFTAAGKWMSFQSNDKKLLYCIQDDGAGHVNCWYNQNTGTYEYGEKTIPTSFGIWLFGGSMTKHTKVEYSAVIQIDTKDGFSTKFPLQVNVADKGYFECRLENEDTKQF